MTPLLVLRHHKNPLCERLQQHPRALVAAATLLELEDVPRCIVVDLVVDKEVDHLALYLEAPVAVGLLDQADTPAH